jgi:hypothetical protein
MAYHLERRRVCCPIPALRTALKLLPTTSVSPGSKIFRSGGIGSAPIRFDVRSPSLLGAPLDQPAPATASHLLLIIRYREKQRNTRRKSLLGEYRKMASTWTA